MSWKPPFGLFISYCHLHSRASETFTPTPTRWYQSKKPQMKWITLVLLAVVRTSARAHFMGQNSQGHSPCGLSHIMSCLFRQTAYPNHLAVSKLTLNRKCIQRIQFRKLGSL